MSEIFRFCFEQLTDPLSLPLNPLAEYVILAIIHTIAYELAFDKVGALYRSSMISGRQTGSFLHWLFRGICFVAMWAIVDMAICAYYFVVEHWVTLLIGLGSILAIVAVVSLFCHFSLRKRLVES